MKIVFLLLQAALSCWAQTKTSGDLTVTGQMGIGTTVPRARLEGRLSSGDSYGLKVSSANGTTMLSLDSGGRLAVGVGTSQASVDVSGAGDAADIGLQLRSGNSTSSVTSSQLVFAYGSSATYRHSIRTRAVETQQLSNSIDFYLWRSTATPSTLGDYLAMSLQASPALSSGSVHIHPVGDPAVELEVSDGLVTGRGTIHLLHSYNPSSLDFKSDVVYLGDPEEQQAYADVKALRHARFRYKSPPGYPDQQLVRGLIFEEAPASIQGPSGSLVFNNRVANLEMALKEVHRRAEALRSRISSIEAARKRNTP